MTPRHTLISFVLAPTASIIENHKGANATGAPLFFHANFAISNPIEAIQLMPCDAVQFEEPYFAFLLASSCSLAKLRLLGVDPSRSGVKIYRKKLRQWRLLFVVRRLKSCELWGQNFWFCAKVRPLLFIAISGRDEEWKLQWEWEWESQFERQSSQVSLFVRSFDGKLQRIDNGLHFNFKRITTVAQVVKFLPLTASRNFPFCSSLRADPIWMSDKMRSPKGRPMCFGRRLLVVQVRNKLLQTGADDWRQASCVSALHKSSSTVGDSRRKWAPSKVQPQLKSLQSVN